MTTTLQSTVLASIEHAPDDVGMGVKFVNRGHGDWLAIHTLNGSMSKSVEQLAKQLADASTDEWVVNQRAKIEKAQKDLEARFTKLATEMKANQPEPDKLAESAAKLKLTSFIVFLDTALADNGLSRDDIVGLLDHPLPVKGQSTTTSANTSDEKERIQAIRVWGRDHGHTVGEKGRLNATLVAEYEAANPAN